MMDFVVNSKQEAIDAAVSAEFTGGNYVSVHGAYAGLVEACSFKKFASGSGGVEITIKTDDGLLCRAMIITMTKEGKSTYEKDGKVFPLPGVNQIRGGLMPITQQKELKAVKKSEDEIVYPGVIGKRLGMLVDIRKSYAEDKKTGKQDTSKIYTNADLKAFFDPATGKTGSELLEGKAAEKKAKIEANLKTIEPVLADASAANSKSDPFGDAGTQGAADPFGGAASQGVDPFATPAAPVQTQASAPVEQAAQQQPAVQEIVSQPAPAVQEQAAQAEPTSAPTTATGGDDFWG